MEKKLLTLAGLHTHSFSAYLDEIRMADGRTGKRIRIDHPEGAAVIPLVTENEIIMVRQYRYALDREMLELPAGKADRGERPEDRALRELREETGYEAGSLHHIYTYAPAIGYSNELLYIYLARDLRQVSGKTDDSEISSVERLTLDQVWELIRKGRIQDGKTIIGLSLMKLSVSSGPIPRPPSSGS